MISDGGVTAGLDGGMTAGCDGGVTLGVDGGVTLGVDGGVTLGTGGAKTGVGADLGSSMRCPVTGSHGMKDEPPIVSKYEPPDALGAVGAAGVEGVADTADGGVTAG